MKEITKYLYLHRRIFVYQFGHISVFDFLLVLLGKYHELTRNSSSFLSCHSWNLCCTHLRILRTYSKTGSNLNLDFPLGLFDTLSRLEGNRWEKSFWCNLLYLFKFVETFTKVFFYLSINLLFDYTFSLTKTYVYHFP